MGGRHGAREPQLARGSPHFTEISMIVMYAIGPAKDKPMTPPTPRIFSAVVAPGDRSASQIPPNRNGKNWMPTT